MKILYVWDADYPWDVRVEKICAALTSSGHRLHILARNLKKRPEHERSGDSDIHRLRRWRSDTLNYALSFPLFFSPFWLLPMNRIVREQGIELIIVRDLPMAIAAIWIGRLRRVPVVFDMAEDYVSMIRDLWESSSSRGLNLLVRNPYLARLVEKYVLRNVDHTLVVVEEMREVVKDGGGDIDQTTIVGNTPPLTFFAREPHMPEALETLRGRFKAIYTGGLEPMRGLQTIIAALPKIVESIPDFAFVVVGDGPNRKVLMEQASATGHGDHVFWPGWVEHRELFDYISSCDVGVIPHLVSRHVDTTVPNKLYDYMGCKLPVVASDARPLSRILNSHGAGETFASGDPESAAQAIIKVRSANTGYGANGFHAVQTALNWKYDAERLSAAVLRVAEGRQDQA